MRGRGGERGRQTWRGTAPSPQPRSAGAARVAEQRVSLLGSVEKRSLRQLGPTSSLQTEGRLSVRPAAACGPPLPPRAPRASPTGLTFPFVNKWRRACSSLALKLPSGASRMADVPFPAALSVRGARFFIGSRRRTKGLFTVSVEGCPAHPGLGCCAAACPAEAGSGRSSSVLMEPGSRVRRGLYHGPHACASCHPQPLCSEKVPPQPSLPLPHAVHHGTAPSPHSLP